MQATFNRIGLQPEMTAVIYDVLGMMDSGRLFWTLEYTGHEDVRVLHGGWNAWNAAGLGTTDTAVEVTPGEYPVQLDAARLVTAQELLDLLGDPQVAIVDSRSLEEYSGEVERFKSAEEIQALLDDLGLKRENETITYCQTLWRGAYAYFLLRLMGF